MPEEKPTTPTRCGDKNKGCCECGSGGTHARACPRLCVCACAHTIVDVQTYTWWDGTGQRCMHTANIPTEVSMPSVPKPACMREPLQHAHALFIACLHIITILIQYIPPLIACIIILHYMHVLHAEIHGWLQAPTKPRPVLMHMCGYGGGRLQPCGMSPQGPNDSAMVQVHTEHSLNILLNIRSNRQPSTTVLR